jgi:catechol 2,3-dioxygenase-like lactoylglutathione lyase family enzyme
VPRPTQTLSLAAPAAVSPPLEGICELALETTDRRGLETFYTAVLGFRVISRDQDRTWLACGPRARLGLWDPGEKEFGDEGGRHVHFAFSAAPGTLVALTQRLETLGVEHRGPLEHDGGDRSLYVEDPAGNVVEFWDFFVRGRTVTALERASAEWPTPEPVNTGPWSASPVRSVTGAVRPTSLRYSGLLYSERAMTTSSRVRPPRDHVVFPQMEKPAPS